mmetsp:Transcript_56279/g.138097  ORF Transcript_56279/g.138097 Transcript_56279/m.138097 type:complete len:363 (-) Transcript_56279:553-1641(-)
MRIDLDVLLRQHLLPVRRRCDAPLHHSSAHEVHDVLRVLVEQLLCNDLVPLARLPVVVRLHDDEALLLARKERVLVVVEHDGVVHRSPAQPLVLELVHDELEALLGEKLRVPIDAVLPREQPVDELCANDLLHRGAHLRRPPELRVRVHHNRSPDLDTEVDELGQARAEHTALEVRDDVVLCQAALTTSGPVGPVDVDLHIVAVRHRHEVPHHGMVHVEHDKELLSDELLALLLLLLHRVVVVADLVNLDLGHGAPHALVRLRVALVLGDHAGVLLDRPDRVLEYLPVHRAPVLVQERPAGARPGWRGPKVVRAPARGPRLLLAPIYLLLEVQVRHAPERVGAVHVVLVVVVRGRPLRRHRR